MIRLSLRTTGIVLKTVVRPAMFLAQRQGLYRRQETELKVAELKMLKLS